MTISQTDEKLDIPVDEFDGKVIYGERRKQEGSKRFACHRDYPFLFSLRRERTRRHVGSNSERTSRIRETRSIVVLCPEK